jgi:MFS transporter, DHA3 family, macrolide efflux protein
MLLPTVGLGSIFALDIATFVYAVGVLVLVRVPRAGDAASARPSDPRTQGPDPHRRSARTFLRDALAGLSFLRGQPGLVSLTAVGSLVSFFLGMVQLLLSPLILTFASPGALGLIDSSGGVGLVAGSLVLSARGGPRRRVAGLLSFMGIQGAILLIAVAKPSIVLAAIGSFCILATFPFIAGCSQTLWQRAVPLELQGRVFSLRTVAANTTFTLASVVSGPLADGLFEPWMAPGGALAGALGPLLGVGPGRGVALLMALLGALILVIASLARLYPPLLALDAAFSPAGEAGDHRAEGVQERSP